MVFAPKTEQPNLLAERRVYGPGDPKKRNPPTKFVSVMAIFHQLPGCHVRRLSDHRISHRRIIEIRKKIKQSLVQACKLRMWGWAHTNFKCRLVASSQKLVRVTCMMSAQTSTHCKSCQSINQSTFNGEIAIHFPGLEGLKKPIVWVFPKLLVCLNCGFTELAIPEAELRQLVESGTAAA